METPVRRSFQNPPVITKVGQDFFNLFGSLQRETGRLVPPRKSLGLAASRTFAPYLSILEIREPKTALVRIVGTAIVSRTHIDNTGKNWFELFPAESIDPIWQAFRHMLDTPRGSLVFAKEEYQRSVVIEVLSFPFADDDGVPRFIVSTTAQVDINDLMLRGDEAMRPGEVMSEHLLDIGAGIGA